MPEARHSPPGPPSGLAAEIATRDCPAPTLWWLGHSGFALKYRASIIYVDPCLSGRVGVDRLAPPPMAGRDVTHAGLILCTHSHPDHLDPGTAPEMLEASRKAKLVVPRRIGEHAHSLGIPYERMVWTDSNLRVEYLDDRVYAVPSAHDQLEWSPSGGYPYLGYLVRFGGFTIYHAGDTVRYEGLADRLKPYTVDVALLPISGRTEEETTLDASEAAQLAEDIGAAWLVPMHYGVFQKNSADVNRFIEHMLGHRPYQKFKVFECGERWTPPPNSGRA
jgi:L-ascorbate metabolism protein UlaG (beta-lactamase superfamily)